MKIECLNPDSLCPTFGWTHVVAATGGKTIHVSGQVSVNERGEVVGRGDPRTQTEQAFQNVARALAAAGASFHDVVKTSLFVVELRPEHVPIIREVRSRFVSAERPPASTLVEVSALVGSDWLIEIEAVADCADRGAGPSDGGAAASQRPLPRGPEAHADGNE